MFGELFTREQRDPRVGFIGSEAYRKLREKFSQHQLVNGTMTGLVPYGEEAYSVYPLTNYTYPLFTFTIRGICALEFNFEGNWYSEAEFIRVLDLLAFW